LFFLEEILENPEEIVVFFISCMGSSPKEFNPHQIMIFLRKFIEWRK